MQESKAHKLVSALLEGDGQPGYDDPLYWQYDADGQEGYVEAHSKEDAINKASKVIGKSRDGEYGLINYKFKKGDYTVSLIDRAKFPKRWNDASKECSYSSAKAPTRQLQKTKPISEVILKRPDEKFRASPDRIDGVVHNTATARLGVAFNYSAMEEIDAVEIAFYNEPRGNMRSIMVVDVVAAKALRDRLDAALKEHDARRLA